MCQCTKVENIATQGKLQPIPAACIPWQDLAIDFPINLLENGVSTSILVVVDQFSKIVHLIPLLSSTKAMDVAGAFFDSVVHLHGLTATIISDRDPRFLSTFWHTLMEKHMGTTLKFNLAFHPKSDGQSEFMIHSIL